MELGLAGKVAVVAAASEGLGYAAARALAKEGASLAVCSRRADAIERAARAIREETGARVVAVPADVSRAADVDRFVGEIDRAFGKVDVLVNNAGGPRAGGFFDMHDGDWQTAFDLLVMSVIRMVRGIVPLMRKSGHGGSIMTLTSYSLKEPVRGLALSNTMRAALAGLSKTLADELGPEGIRVNVIVQGRFATERLRELDTIRAQKEGISYDEVVKRSTATIPLRRYGDPEELARVIAFLASDAASYVTGAAWTIDGGLVRSLL
ncbi:MAG: SDR family oxidoreductase [Limnochordaceae bacterium]|nr:SDR family oxidoreductase [Limnochordaceae bacterium]